MLGAISEDLGNVNVCVCWKRRLWTSGCDVLGVCTVGNLGYTVGREERTCAVIKGYSHDDASLKYQQWLVSDSLRVVVVGCLDGDGMRK